MPRRICRIYRINKRRITPRDSQKSHRSASDQGRSTRRISQGATAFLTNFRGGARLWKVTQARSIWWHLWWEAPATSLRQQVVANESCHEWASESRATWRRARFFISLDPVWSAIRDQQPPDNTQESQLAIRVWSFDDKPAFSFSQWVVRRRGSTLKRDGFSRYRETQGSSFTTWESRVIIKIKSDRHRRYRAGFETLLRTCHVVGEKFFVG